MRAEFQQIVNRTLASGQARTYDLYKDIKGMKNMATKHIISYVLGL